MTERRGGWPGPRKDKLAVRLDPAQLARVEAYAQQHGVKRSEAVRRAVAAGLDRLEAEENEAVRRAIAAGPDILEAAAAGETTPHPPGGMSDERGCR